MSTSLTGPAPAATSGHRPPAAHPWRPLLVRMHFYAGVLIGPFVLVLCLSGLAYAASPQLERLVYRHELVADPAGRQPLPLSAQVESAVAARPELRMSGVRTADEPDQTTRVDFADPTLETMVSRSVFVDPYTAQVRGELVTRHGRTAFVGWLSTLHADLHLGEPGRVYSELATSWLIVVLVGGVVLWWERSRRHRKPGREGSRACWRRFLVVDRSHPGVHRTMSWHAVAGVWVVIIALALSLTGLMASVSAGSRWTGLLASLDASAPRLSTQVGPPGAPTAPGGHAEHGAPTPAGADRPATGRVPDGVSIDAVLAAARTAGVTESVNLTAPRAPGQGWSASETDLTLPVNLDQAVVDPASGRVVRTQAWADWPVLAQANRLLLFFHFNRTLGGVGQVLLIGTMIAVTASVLWGYQMWWQRRPQHGGGLRLGRAPRRGAWRAAPRGRLTAAVVATAIVGVILPVFGVSLLGFLLLDAAIGYLRRHRRDVPTPADADLHGPPTG